MKSENNKTYLDEDSQRRLYNLLSFALPVAPSMVHKCTALAYLRKHKLYNVQRNILRGLIDHSNSNEIPVPHLSELEESVSHNDRQGRTSWQM